MRFSEECGEYSMMSLEHKSYRSREHNHVSLENTQEAFAHAIRYWHRVGESPR